MANERLIDANALWEKADALEMATAEEWGWQEMCDGISQVKELISEAPTVDAVPVVHGWWKWYREENCVICSECCDVHYLGTMHQYSKNYCPNCGARMDGGRDV